MLERRLIDVFSVHHVKSHAKINISAPPGGFVPGVRDATGEQAIEPPADNAPTWPYGIRPAVRHPKSQLVSSKERRCNAISSPQQA